MHDYCQDATWNATWSYFPASLGVPHGMPQFPPPLIFPTLRTRGGVYCKELHWWIKVTRCLWSGILVTGMPLEVAFWFRMPLQLLNNPDHNNQPSSITRHIESPSIFESDVSAREGAFRSNLCHILHRSLLFSLRFCVAGSVLTKVWNQVRMLLHLFE